MEISLDLHFIFSFDCFVFFYLLELGTSLLPFKLIRKLSLAPATVVQAKSWAGDGGGCTSGLLWHSPGGGGNLDIQSQILGGALKENIF